MSVVSAPSATIARTKDPRIRLVIMAVVLAIAIVAFLFLFVRGSWAFAIPRRATVIGAMTIAAFAQGVGTVIFHTVTQNRILTPSIMGFESMYTLMQTMLVWFFGGSAVAQTEGYSKLILQTALMVILATLLYRWLFSGTAASLHVLLLVGVVFGMAFSSVSEFMQRLLNPTDYDMLSVKLFGRLSSLDATYLPLAGIVCGVVAVILWRRRFVLDTLLLGRETAINLGINYRRELTLILALTALLISFSTALVGPLTFFGFMVASITYQIAGTYRHGITMPMAFLLGMLTLVIGQFVLQHVFYAAGFLTVIIEFVGGIAFLFFLLKRGNL